MSSHDVERAYVAAMLDSERDRLDEASAAMSAELDHLRESWSSGYAQQLADHDARMAKMRDDQAAWFRGLYDDEPVPTDVAQGQAHAPAAGSSPASPPGPGSGQPNHHADELERARAIKAMSMQDYAAERARLGIQSGTARGMFG